MAPRASLPPGPRAPAALQTWMWIARPAAFLERAAERHGTPFTLRIAWADAPIVLVSDPEDVKRVFTAGPDQLRGGSSSNVLEPFAGPTSILVLDGEPHLRQRRLMLPPFHGDRLRDYAGRVRELAERELASWPRGTPIAVHERMRALTLEVIVQVVFGAREGERLDALRAAVGRTLAMASSLPRLAGMSLLQRDLGPRSPWGAFRRAVAGVDALLYDLIRERRERPGEGAVIDLLLQARHEDGSPPSERELRDQLVTLLAAGHETTAGALAWAFERLARHPAVQERLRADADGSYLDAVVDETLRVRPVLSIAPRKVVGEFAAGGRTLPPGVHVAACIHLTHRRPELYPDPAAFRPERWLDGAERRPYAFIPFGGGVRRCVGAAFARLEMREVLGVAARRLELAPERAAGERVRRRTVTLSPARGARIVTRTLAPSR